MSARLKAVAGTTGAPAALVVNNISSSDRWRWIPVLFVVQHP